MKTQYDKYFGKLRKIWTERISGSLIVIALSALSTLGSLTSCRHKYLDFEEVPMTELDVVFDWSKAPDATPESMAVYFYDTQTRSEAKALRYDFPNKSGGEIKLPFSNYSAIALNSDNTHWAHFRNSDDIDNFEIYTNESSHLPTSGLAIKSIPRARDTEDEVIVETPEMFWTARRDSLSLAPGDKRKTFTFYPEEGVCHYKVIVRNISNFSSIEGSAIDATLSGMSGGFLHGSKQPTDSKCTLPFYLIKDEDTETLHGEFLTFGESPVTHNPHKLALYIIMSDGKRNLYSYDVASQISKAKDPKHVTIIVDGLSLPTPVPESGGLNPSVSDWDSIDIDIQM
ncbi:MAG: DUF5119 domain-containing protein [Muribaculaceae bacterium]|nr:DUF5119 domain-containing protein [Muribaculaceae bacterium]